jgi:hypothetical protein
MVSRARFGVSTTPFHGSKLLFEASCVMAKLLFFTVFLPFFAILLKLNFFDLS